MADPRPRATAFRPVALAGAAGLAGLLRPVAVLASTPVVPRGDPGDIQPAGLVDQLLPIVGPLVGIAIVGTVVVALGVVVARLGGTPGAATDRRGSARRVLALGAVALVAMLLGYGAGREIAHERNVGMFLPGLIPIVLLVVSSGGLGLVGLVALAIRRGRPSVAIGALLLAAIALALGAVGGDRTADADRWTAAERIVLGSAGPEGDTTDATAMAGGWSVAVARSLEWRGRPW